MSHGLFFLPSFLSSFSSSSLSQWNRWRYNRGRKRRMGGVTTLFHGLFFLPSFLSSFSSSSLSQWNRWRYNRGRVVSPLCSLICSSFLPSVLPPSHSGAAEDSLGETVGYTAMEGKCGWVVPPFSDVFLPSCLFPMWASFFLFTFWCCFLPCVLPFLWL